MTALSVLLPVYNASAFLAEAIESVLNQTWPTFELLLIDDGSTDDSAVILAHYARQDSRVRVLSHENRGMGESLNRGLQETDTDWIARMDADDRMLPHRLERQLAFLRENPDVRVTSCLAQYIDARGRLLGKTAADLLSREKFRWYVDHQEAIGLLHPGVMMHRRTVLDIGGYRGRFWPAEDIDLWNRLAEAGHLILLQDEVLMRYRLHGGSVITSGFLQGRMKYEWVRACLLARRRGEAEPDWEAFQAAWREAPWWIGLNRLRKQYAKYFYRKAGHDRMTGHLLSACGELALATLLQPGYTLNRLRHQLGP